MVIGGSSLLHTSVARSQRGLKLHAVEKSLKDLGDKVDGGERAKVESALSDLRGER